MDYNKSVYSFNYNSLLFTKFCTPLFTTWCKQQQLVFFVIPLFKEAGRIINTVRFVSQSIHRECGRQYKYSNIMTYLDRDLNLHP